MTHKPINTVSLNRKGDFYRLKVTGDSHVSFDRMFVPPQIKLCHIMMPVKCSLLECQRNSRCDILGPTHRHVFDVNTVGSVEGYSVDLYRLFIDIG